MSNDARMRFTWLRRALTRLRHEQSGVTLIEALVASMVLLIGIVPTIKVFNDSRDQNATGERHEIALLQAEQALEEMRGLPYDRLLLNAGVVDPGGGRATTGGTTLQVRSDLSEPLVYATTENVATGNAWVDPITEVTTGATEAPVHMTIHRFVSWRDEECRVADLSGLDLPGAIDTVDGPLLKLVDGVLDGLLQIVPIIGGDRSLLSSLNSRLEALQAALSARRQGLDDAITGLGQLDLCDLDLEALEELQELGRLTSGFDGPNELSGLLSSLDSALAPYCPLKVLCGRLTAAQVAAVGAVNTQLNCLFGPSADTANEFGAHLDNLALGLSGLSDDLADTGKNTKRITVAVVVEPRNGVGPFEPVWASSVVRDPTAGLLSGSSGC